MAATRTARSRHRSLAVLTLILAVGFVLLYLLSQRSYLAFHMLAETFAVVVAFSIFVFVWNSRRHLGYSFLFFLGVAHLFVGGMDLIHTFAYKGMSIFAPDDTNLPTQLWLAARYLMTLGWLGAALLVGRRVRPAPVLAGFSLIFAGLLAAIFWWRVFPVAHVEGLGLTTFKVYSEYAICLGMTAAVALLSRRREQMDPRVSQLLIWAAGIAIVSELSFTLYVDVYGFLNFFGHFLKIISMYLLLTALVEQGIKRPFSMLFHDLQQSQEELQEEREQLDRRVQERTHELADVNERLRRLASELALAEERERRRIATEIHDSLSQTLAFSKMLLGGLLAKQETAGVRGELEQLRAMVESAIADTRSITFELSPPVLYTMGLEAALQWLGRQAEERHGIAFHYESEGAPPLTDDLRITLFQAVREMLNNMAKHARAQNAWIRVCADDSALWIEVEDDGVGFDVAQAEWRADQSSGFGLFNIRERLQQVGGFVEIDSAPGRGTRISLSAPVHAPAPAATAAPDSSATPAPAADFRRDSDAPHQP